MLLYFILKALKSDNWIFLLMNNDIHFVEDVLIDASEINYAFIVTQVCVLYWTDQTGFDLTC